MIPFVHLHVHSQYSILDGMAPVKSLVDKAIADGMRGMAITDHGNMYGIKEFHDYVSKLNKKREEKGEEKFKPIFGCEVYVAWNDRHDRNDKRDNGNHLILLAKNLKGYKNLIKIVSHAWTEGMYYHPRTDHSELEKYHEGIICCSACLGGEVPQLIMGGRLQEARETIQWFKSVFGDDYYLELQRHKATVARANHETYEKQCMVNDELIKFARELDIKLICSNDSHFVNEEDADAHERLICVSTGRKLSDENVMLYSKQEWFKTTEEMNEVFADIPEALQNTNEILDKVEIYSIDHAPILPDFPLPDGFDNEDDYLRYLVYEGAKERWPDLDDEHRERLDFELETIKNMGFPGYFLIVQDYIRMAPKLGCSVGPGRGSAAGSAVAYCLGITKIDPMKYDLLFERFLNPDRISLPDIDTDFDDDGRAAVLNYVTDKYGAEKVAHIVTYGTMAAKSAIKDVARVEDLSIDESNRLAKFIPSSPNEMPEDKNGKKPKITVKNCLESFDNFRAELDNQDPRVGETIRFAEKLEGNIRSTGVHACGVIIGRDDITDWVPVSTATDSDGEKIIVTQYEGGVIESTGLIKMDFLGLKNLSIIKEALANIKINHGVDIDIEKIPIDDPKTYALYCKGQTSATFQFESAGMQKCLIELHPTCFEDLIAMNALYRPGPMDYIPSFINRKHGKEPIEYDIPCMEKYLKETYGITVYQEQVMLLSRQLAGFTRGQSDTLRKAMGKKQIEKMNELEALFYEGGEKNGYDKKVLNKIWEDWKKFASYAFNKSHATCYSWVAYQTAYLKANYPSEYMAAVLSSNLNDITTLSKYMDECRSMGIEVLGPNINESYNRFSATKDGRIRFGLAGIKGVGVGCVDAIVEEREKNGPYQDIFDFVQRVNQGACNRKALESMALAGAFDDFKDIKREDFFEVNPRGEAYSETLMRFGQRYQTSKQEMQNSLFGAFDDAIEVATPPIPHAEPWSQLERLNRERDLVGMYLSAHPLDPYYIEVKYGCDTPLSEVNQRADKLDQEITMGGIVVDFQTRMGKKGGQFGILKIEDYSGSFEFMLFGNKFVDYQKFGVPGLAIVVRGAYEKGYGDKVRFNMRSIDLLENLKGKMVKNLVISLKDEDLGSVGFLKERVGAEGDNRCELYFRMKDQSSGNYVMLRSKKLVAVDKRLMESLQEAGIRFKVNARV
ncbi:MAG: DNA polymerase III subunit alpha [Muribaculaceae bacterium]|nr:DNA polymerase III subunit alpha [Muribaculaceae bacterium]